MQNSPDWNRGGLMLVLKLGLILALAQAQEMPSPQAMQAQAQRISQERPREAEAAARAFLQLVAADRIGGLDSPKATPLDAYWMEVGQLVAQFDLVQNLVRRDTVRAGLVSQMFATEAQARALQRAYRNAPEARRQSIRGQLESLMGQHFDLEDK